MDIKFTFTKLWYPTEELLEIIPISRATLYRMHRELIEQGKDGSEMGKVKIQGCENTLWCPIKFVSYLQEHKILTAKIKYDYEKSEQDNVKVAIGYFNNNHKKEKERRVV